MKAKPLVIIHGWSDNAGGMRRLARLLERRLNRRVTHLYLADYITMDDTVRMDDIVCAMDKAWSKVKLPRKPFSVDVLVHSTGGLVIRAWLTKYFRATTSPVKHLVMLAPANFGSPLAHKGRALLGRVLKGFSGNKWFETGTHILQALEIGSPYTWDLALQDRFGREKYYDKGRILCTVLVGDTGYTGLASAANGPGTDGTVRLSTANMNCAYLSLDFSKMPERPELRIQKSKGRCAFAIMTGENHTTITGHSGGPKNKKTIDTIVAALTVRDEDFTQFIRHCQSLSQERDKDGDLNLYAYQNTVTHVCDQFKHEVSDYFLEFYAKGNEKHWLTEMFHGDLIQTVHAYGADKSYRSLLFNCTKLFERLTTTCPILQMSLTALPTISPKQPVGYKTLDKKTFPGLGLSCDDLKALFKPNRSLLVDITIQRYQSDKVFRFV